ncbi:MULTISPECIES: Trk system potassium transporter TrkA [Methylophaga]|uniref:Trk system potassium uptake protein TrkA n=1 Tax=Methylophaga marina TaxID=45495 RepID=A0ABP3D4L5_9GAMM|nr:Trk system potassium transporter TrkA [Methylophaga marina]BDZ75349.1 Trk system potassium transport protein TrkA [Methylophaga marina]
MKIIILGAGQVGGSTAESLVNEGNDVTVVDTDSYLLERIQDRLDIRAVNGHASSPETLIAAGIEDADMLIAVTQNDEVNMVACQVANALFKTPKKLARIRASDYVEYPALFSPDAFATDVIISPEQLVTAYIQRLIEQPEVLQVVEFFDGMAQLVAVEVSEQSPMAGKPISKLLDILPDIKMRVAAIFRDNQAIQATGREALQPGDEIFFLALTQHISKLVKVFRHAYKTYERILIAGGGNIGRQLAKRIETNHKVKIIEMDPKRARFIAEGLKKSVVLHGDAGDANLLQEENISKTDVFCAVTNDDEVNILSAMLAKRMGARKVISIIGKASHVELVRGTSIDLAISPAQITIGSLLTHIRKGDVVTVHSLRQGAAEAIEVIAHGDLTTSKVVGRHIEQIKLPASASVAAILRNEHVLFSDKSLVIEPDDHLIIFISNQRDIMAVEKLFQVDFNYLM